MPRKPADAYASACWGMMGGLIGYILAMKYVGGEYYEMCETWDWPQWFSATVVTATSGFPGLRLRRFAGLLFCREVEFVAGALCDLVVARYQIFRHWWKPTTVAICADRPPLPYNLGSE